MAAYEKDKHNIYFDKIVKDEINTRSIIKVRNVLKLVKYPPPGGTRGAEAKEMNALENYLLSHVEVYHDAFSKPVESLLFCKLCNSRINVNYKCFEKTDFSKYLPFHFCADEGKTFLEVPTHI